MKHDPSTAAVKAVREAKILDGAMPLREDIVMFWARELDKFADATLHKCALRIYALMLEGATTNTITDAIHGMKVEK